MEKTTALPLEPFLVSCLCVTMNRPHFLRRAIQCFLTQTYQNRELIVIHHNDSGTEALMGSYANVANVKQIVVPADLRLSLGELRNLAIKKCNGDFFCQWDDDDWHHNSRLERQMNAIMHSKKSCCALEKQLIYDTTTGHAYLSPIGPWAGTVLCKKSIISERIQYPPYSRGEDSAFIFRLFSVNSVYPFLAPTMYIYTFHGANTWNGMHFRRIFRHSKKLSIETAALIQKILSGELTNEQASVLLEDQRVADDIDFFYIARPTIEELLVLMLMTAKAIIKRLLSLN